MVKKNASTVKRKPLAECSKKGAKRKKIDSDDCNSKEDFKEDKVFQSFYQNRENCLEYLKFLQKVSSKLRSYSKLFYCFENSIITATTVFTALLDSLAEKCPEDNQNDSEVDFETPPIVEKFKVLLPDDPHSLILNEPSTPKSNNCKSGKNNVHFNGTVNISASTCESKVSEKMVNNIKVESLTSCLHPSSEFSYLDPKNNAVNDPEKPIVIKESANESNLKAPLTKYNLEIFNELNNENSSQISPTVDKTSSHSHDSSVNVRTTGRGGVTRSSLGTPNSVCTSAHVVLKRLSADIVIKNSSSSALASLDQVAVAGGNFSSNLSKSHFANETSHKIAFKSPPISFSSLSKPYQAEVTVPEGNKQSNVENFRAIEKNSNFLVDTNKAAVIELPSKLEMQEKRVDVVARKSPRVRPGIRAVQDVEKIAENNLKLVTKDLHDSSKDSSCLPIVDKSVSNSYQEANPNFCTNKKISDRKREEKICCRDKPSVDSSDKRANDGSKTEFSVRRIKIRIGDEIWPVKSTTPSNSSDSETSTVFEVDRSRFGRKQTRRRGGTKSNEAGLRISVNPVTKLEQSTNERKKLLNLDSSLTADELQFLKSDYSAESSLNNFPTGTFTVCENKSNVKQLRNKSFEVKNLEGNVKSLSSNSSENKDLKNVLIAKLENKICQETINKETELPDINSSAPPTKKMLDSCEVPKAKPNLIKDSEGSIMNAENYENLSLQLAPSKLIDHGKLNLSSSKRLLRRRPEIINKEHIENPKSKSGEENVKSVGSVLAETHSASTRAFTRSRKSLSIDHTRPSSGPSSADIIEEASSVQDDIEEILTPIIVKKIRSSTPKELANSVHIDSIDASEIDEDSPQPNWIDCSMNDENRKSSHLDTAAANSKTIFISDSSITSNETTRSSLKPSSNRKMSAKSSLCIVNMSESTIVGPDETSNNSGPVTIENPPETKQIFNKVPRKEELPNSSCTTLKQASDIPVTQDVNEIPSVTADAVKSSNEGHKAVSNEKACSKSSSKTKVSGASSVNVLNSVPLFEELPSSAPIKENGIKVKLVGKDKLTEKIPDKVSLSTVDETSSVVSTPDCNNSKNSKIVGSKKLKVLIRSNLGSMNKKVRSVRKVRKGTPPDPVLDDLVLEHINQILEQVVANVEGSNTTAEFKSSVPKETPETPAAKSSVSLAPSKLEDDKKIFDSVKEVIDVVATNVDILCSSSMFSKKPKALNRKKRKSEVSASQASSQVKNQIKNENNKEMKNSLKASTIGEVKCPNINGKTENNVEKNSQVLGGSGIEGQGSALKDRMVQNSNVELKKTKNVSKNSVIKKSKTEKESVKDKVEASFPVAFNVNSAVVGSVFHNKIGHFAKPVSKANEKTLVKEEIVGTNSLISKSVNDVANSRLSDKMSSTANNAVNSVVSNVDAVGTSSDNICSISSFDTKQGAVEKKRQKSETDGSSTNSPKTLNKNLANISTNLLGSKNTLPEASISKLTNKTKNKSEKKNQQILCGSESSGAKVDDSISEGEMIQNCIDNLKKSNEAKTSLERKDTLIQDCADKEPVALAGFKLDQIILPPHQMAEAIKKGLFKEEKMDRNTLTCNASTKTDSSNSSTAFNIAPKIPTNPSFCLASKQSSNGVVDNSVADGNSSVSMAVSSTSSSCRNSSDSSLFSPSSSSSTSSNSYTSSSSSSCCSKFLISKDLLSNSKQNEFAPNFNENLSSLKGESKAVLTVNENKSFIAQTAINPGGSLELNLTHAINSLSSGKNSPSCSFNFRQPENKSNSDEASSYSSPTKNNMLEASQVKIKKPVNPSCEPALMNVGSNSVPLASSEPNKQLLDGKNSNKPVEVVGITNKVNPSSNEVSRSFTTSQSKSIGDKFMNITLAEKANYSRNKQEFPIQTRNYRSTAERNEPSHHYTKSIFDPDSDIETSQLGEQNFLTSSRHKQKHSVTDSIKQDTPHEDLDDFISITTSPIISDEERINVSNQYPPAEDRLLTSKSSVSRNNYSPIKSSQDLNTFPSIKENKNQGNESVRPECKNVGRESRPQPFVKDKSPNSFRLPAEVASQASISGPNLSVSTNQLSNISSSNPTNHQSIEKPREPPRASSNKPNSCNFSPNRISRADLRPKTRLDTAVRYSNEFNAEPLRRKRSRSASFEPDQFDAFYNYGHKKDAFRKYDLRTNLHSPNAVSFRRPNVTLDQPTDFLNSPIGTCKNNGNYRCPSGSSYSQCIMNPELKRDIDALYQPTLNTGQKISIIGNILCQSYDNVMMDHILEEVYRFIATNPLPKDFYVNEIVIYILNSDKVVSQGALMQPLWIITSNLIILEIEENRLDKAYELFLIMTKKLDLDVLNRSLKIFHPNCTSSKFALLLIKLLVHNKNHKSAFSTLFRLKLHFLNIDKWKWDKHPSDAVFQKEIFRFIFKTLMEEDDELSASNLIKYAALIIKVNLTKSYNEFKEFHLNINDVLYKALTFKMFKEALEFFTVLSDPLRSELENNIWRCLVVGAVILGDMEEAVKIMSLATDMLIYPYMKYKTTALVVSVPYFLTVEELQPYLKFCLMRRITTMIQFSKDRHYLCNPKTASLSIIIDENTDPKRTYSQQYLEPMKKESIRNRVTRLKEKVMRLLTDDLKIEADFENNAVRVNYASYLLFLNMNKLINV